MRSAIGRIFLTALAAAILPIVTGIAASSLPRLIQPYQWTSWLVLPVLIIPITVSEFRKEHQTPPLPVPEGILVLRLPEEAAEASDRAYRHQRFLEAFEASVEAVERLHNYYVFDGLKHRQPSAKDGWIVQGLTSALGAARAVNPQADVRTGVVTAVARLHDIVDAARSIGLNPTIYLQGLFYLNQYAPDIEF